MPEDALCPDLCGGSSTVNGHEYVSTYDEAYAFWLEYGRHPEKHTPVDTTPANNEPINQPTDTVDSDYEPGEIIVDPDTNVFYY